MLALQSKQHDNIVIDTLPEFGGYSCLQLQCLRRYRDRTHEGN